MSAVPRFRPEPLVPRVTPFLAIGEPRPARRFPITSPRLDAHDVLGLSIGDLDIYRMRVSPRPIRTARSNSPQRCVLLCRSAGTLTVQSDVGDPVEVPAGQLCLAQNSTGYLTTCRTPTWLTAMVLPVSLLTEFGVSRPNQVLQVQPCSTLVAPMWRFVDSLLDQPLPWQPLSAYYAEKLIHELLASVLLEATAMPSVPLADRTLVERARQHIRAYARDPRLTPQRVAESLGVPLRRLQRRFAEVESSLGREVRHARASAAIAMIRSREAEMLDMDAIAGLCGYPNAVAMRRSFAKLGLDPPRNYRQGPSTRLR